MIDTAIDLAILIVAFTSGGVFVSMYWSSRVMSEDHFGVGSAGGREFICLSSDTFDSHVEMMIAATLVCRISEDCAKAEDPEKVDALFELLMEAIQDLSHRAFHLTATHGIDLNIKIGDKDQDQQEQSN